MVQCRSGLWLVFTLSILLQASAQAVAEWIALDARYQSHPLQTAYAAPGTIRREGDIVTLSALIEWKEMQGGRTPTRFYSTKLTKQFDCVGKLARTLVATDFYGHMATGEVIGGGVPANESQWIPIESETINEGLWNTACQKR